MFTLPMQIIDRMRGVHPASFFDVSVVTLAAFGDTFARRLVQWLAGPVRRMLTDEGRGVGVVTNACIMCVEGPQFSTCAESMMNRQWGG